jgi:hypothetical protein
MRFQVSRVPDPILSSGVSAWVELGAQGGRQLFGIADFPDVQRTQAFDFYLISL